MSKTRFTPWIVLACIGTLAGCTSGEGGTAGNTEMNVIVPNNAGQSSNPAAFDIQIVEYTIACNDGNTPGPFLDNAATFDDDITISGVLEVLDTASGGVTIQDFGPDLTEVYVWQGFMDLPPTAGCTVQLRARDADGEVICTATEVFDIAADSTTKVNVLMYCGISFQAPVGMLDLDGDFSFNVANFCPDLFVLNCVSSNPQVQVPGIPPVTYCETRFRDGDSSCGGTGVAPGDPDGASSCDPQLCVFTPEGLDCAPSGAIDPPVQTTITCDQLLDCEGDFIPDASCVFAGDTTGTIGAGVPVPVVLGGPGPDPGGFFTGCLTCTQAFIDATGGVGVPGVCDSVTGPTGLVLFPGQPTQCTAVTTDGDTDCDKTKVVTLVCPGLNFCDEPTTDCDDGNECTDDSCDSNAGACVNTNTPAGQGPNCSTAPGGGLGECDGNGFCDDFGCTGQADCDNAETDPCLVAGACNLGTGFCAPSTPGNDGASCDSGTGSGDGTCGGGICNSNDTCLVASDCDDANDCTSDVCSGVPLACSNPFEPAGTPCNAGTGACDGAGVCALPFVLNDDAGGVSTWQALPKLCTEGIFDPTEFSYVCCAGAGNPAGCIGSGATTTDVPGGGLASGTSDPTSVVDGCSVPSSTLGGQLAVDVTLFLTTSSSGGNLITDYRIEGVNAGLGLAAAIANLVDLTVETGVTSGTPSSVFNVLNAANQNTPLAGYISGLPATLILDSEIDTNSEPVVPSTVPGMGVNFTGQFLLELFLTTAMSTLPVDGNSCVFDLPGPDINLSTTDPN